MLVDKITLAQAVAKNGNARLTYLYDFGDDSEHQIKIGTTREAAPDRVMIWLIYAAKMVYGPNRTLSLSAKAWINR